MRGADIRSPPRKRHHKGPFTAVHACKIVCEAPIRKPRVLPGRLAKLWIDDACRR